jgi:hypothetical protein
MMKNQIIAGLALFYVMTASSFAMEIHNGKLLSQRHWTTGNVMKETITESKAGSKKQMEFFLKTKNNIEAGKDYINTRIALSPGNEYHIATAYAGEEFLALGDNDLFLYNTTGTVQTYNLVTSVCSVKKAACSMHEYQFELGIDGYFSEYDFRELTITYADEDIGEDNEDTIYAQVKVTKPNTDTVYIAHTDIRVFVERREQKQ